MTYLHQWVQGKFDDNEVKKAINKYETLMAKSNKLFGYHVTDPKQDQVIAKIKKDIIL